MNMEGTGLPGSCFGCQVLAIHAPGLPLRVFRACCSNAAFIAKGRPGVFSVCRSSRQCKMDICSVLVCTASYGLKLIANFQSRVITYHEAKK